MNVPTDSIGRLPMDRPDEASGTVLRA